MDVGQMIGMLAEKRKADPKLTLIDVGYIISVIINEQ